MIVTAQDVKDYTESQKVKAREDSKIEKDILLAISKIKTLFRKNNKTMTEVLKELKETPIEIKQAVILYAEYYAKKAIDASNDSYKSETYDDYSYQRSSFDELVKEPDVQPLIEEFLRAEKSNIQVKFRMRVF